MIIYQKEYNCKLCYKGLLERGMSNKKYFGDIKKLENEFLIKASNSGINGKDLLSDFINRKMIVTKNELDTIKIRMTGLSKAIGNVKKCVQLLTNDFLLWKMAQAN